MIARTLRFEMAAEGTVVGGFDQRPTLTSQKRIRNVEASRATLFKLCPEFTVSLVGNR
jgi:hypothetical protein